jgi:hypothetical protein
MNRLDSARRSQVISALIEGNSIRATVRMTGVAKNTVVKLLADIGTACARFHDETVRGVASERLQCDEVWSFCYAKQANVPEEKKGTFGFGDVWTFTGLDADSKLIVSWLVGMRTEDCTRAFMFDLASRVSTKHPQVTTDGWHSYPHAVDDAFHLDAEYAQLIKHYRQ